MVRNEYDELYKVMKQVIRPRMDPLSKLFLAVIIGVPILCIIAIIALWKVYKSISKARASAPVKTKTKPRRAEVSTVEDIPVMPKTDVIYYDIKKLQTSQHSLTQYINFYVSENGELVDVTKAMQRIYPYMQYYTGRSLSCKGTAVFTDYDVVKLHKSLNHIKFERTYT